MSDWYVSSAAYSSIPIWQTLTAYSIGDIIKPTAPAEGAKYTFRCTTAGTSGGTQPTWPSGNNSTVTDGTAHWTNVSGQSAYFWAAAAGDVITLATPGFTFDVIPGDRVFISSDHSETWSSEHIIGGIGSGWLTIQYLCVNRAGSTPPVAADLTTGATITGNNLGFISSILLQCGCNFYCYGIAFAITGNTWAIQFGNGTYFGKSIYMKNCSFTVNTVSANLPPIQMYEAAVTWDSCNVVFTAADAANGLFELGKGTVFEWINTPTNTMTGALLSTFTASLFQSSNQQVQYSYFRGLDFSNITHGNILRIGTCATKFLFDSCKIPASGVAKISYNDITFPFDGDAAVFVNCTNGTNVVNEKWTQNGTLTTEFSITLQGGATDDIGLYSHKMVSTAMSYQICCPMESFWMDMFIPYTGVSHTATVELLSSVALNNDEIFLALEYQGTAGSTVTSFVDTFPGIMATNSLISTSTATWNSVGVLVKQKLSVTFTPQQLGRIRGQVRLGKPSTTVYINPQITVS